MRNERGNVIALVLLILSVVSLIGAGTMLMSKYDMKFSSAFTSYDKGFNLADGAALAAYRRLQTMPSGSAPTRNFTGKKDLPPSSSPESTESTVSYVIGKGKVDSTLLFMNYTTDPNYIPPGEESGTGTTVNYWLGTGSTAASNKSFVSNVEVTLSKIERGN